MKSEVQASQIFLGFGDCCFGRILFSQVFDGLLECRDRATFSASEEVVFPDEEPVWVHFAGEGFAESMMPSAESIGSHPLGDLLRRGVSEGFDEQVGPRTGPADPAASNETTDMRKQDIRPNFGSHLELPEGDRLHRHGEEFKKLAGLARQTRESDMSDIHCLDAL